MRQLLRKREAWRWLVAGALIALAVSIGAVSVEIRVTRELHEWSALDWAILSLGVLLLGRELLMIWRRKE